MAYGGGSGTASWHDETDTRLVSLEIDFTWSRYFAATWDNPAEGGEIELGVIRLADFWEYNEDGDVVRKLTDLTADEQAAIVAEYDQRIDADKKMRDSVYEACGNVEYQETRD